jgi:hypothetical protein
MNSSSKRSPLDEAFEADRLRAALERSRRAFELQFRIDPSLSGALQRLSHELHILLEKTFEQVSRAIAAMRLDAIRRWERDFDGRLKEIRDDIEAFAYAADAPHPVCADRTRRATPAPRAQATPSSWTTALRAFARR